MYYCRSPSSHFYPHSAFFFRTCVVCEPPQGIVCIDVYHAYIELLLVRILRCSFDQPHHACPSMMLNCQSTGALRSERKRVCLCAVVFDSAIYVRYIGAERILLWFLFVCWMCYVCCIHDVCSKSTGFMQFDGGAIMLHCISISLGAWWGNVTVSLLIRCTLLAVLCDAELLTV